MHHDVVLIDEDAEEPDGVEQRVAALFKKLSDKGVLQLRAGRVRKPSDSVGCTVAGPSNGASKSEGRDVTYECCSHR